MGQIENARKDLEHALSIAPDQKSADNARQVLKVVLSAPTVTSAPATAPKQPEDEAAEVRECQTLVEAGKYVEGLARSEAVAKKYPKSAGAKFYQAYCLQRLGKQWDRAVALYGEALTLGYAEFWVRYNRGLLYSQIGQKAKAKEDLDRALALTSDPRIAETIKHVRAGLG